MNRFSKIYNKIFDFTLEKTTSLKFSHLLNSTKKMTNDDKPQSVSCPLCSHCFHEECMNVWLESQSKCSYCSNDFWQYYKRIQAGEKEIDLGCNQL